MNITIKRILKEIGCDKLDLWRSPEGYHYFIYDDVSLGIYETHTIMAYRLNHLDFERWVEYGKDFVAKTEASRAEH